MKQEIIEMRTRNSKTFDNGDNTRTTHLCKNGIHYIKDGHYEDIDTNIGENGYMTKAGYTFNFVGNKITFSKGSDWIEFEVDKLQWSCDKGHSIVGLFDNNVVPVINGNEVIWNDAFGTGIHLLYGCSPDGIYKKVIIDDYIEPPAHLIDETQLILEVVLKYKKSDIHVRVNGKLEDFNNYRYVRNEKIIFGDNKFELVIPRVWDSMIDSDIGHRIITKNIIKTGVMHSFLIKSLYPFILDTDVNEQVGASTDDCFEVVGTSYSHGTTTVWFGERYVYPVGYEDYDSAFRWATVAIPKDANISSAVLSLYMVSDSGDLEATIKGIDEDNTVTWDTTDRPSARNKTTATINADDGNWGNLGIGNWITIDIANIISEITSRASWSSGNALAIVIENDKDVGTEHQYEVRTWDYAGNAHGAKLDVTYSAVGAGVRPPRVFLGPFHGPLGGPI